MRIILVRGQIYYIGGQIYFIGGHNYYIGGLNFIEKKTYTKISIISTYYYGKIGLSGHKKK
jgi:hypothetical protein